MFVTLHNFDHQQPTIFDLNLHSYHHDNSPNYQINIRNNVCPTPTGHWKKKYLESEKRVLSFKINQEGKAVFLSTFFSKLIQPLFTLKKNTKPTKQVKTKNKNKKQNKTKKNKWTNKQKKSKKTKNKTKQNKIKKQQQQQQKQPEKQPELSPKSNHHNVPNSKNLDEFLYQNPAAF